MTGLHAHITRFAVLAVWLTLLPGLVSANALERLFAPKSEPWPRWEQHAESDTRQISHKAWDRFLKAHLARGEDGVARMDYAGVSAQDRTLLDDYISGLVSHEISGYNRSEQFAYWVNLYNALTVQVILDHYPVASIRDIDISPGLLADGPWRKQLVKVEGEPLSLDDIEHRILRPLWADPRIHYAVNCAAIGCPNLQSVAFTAENTEQMLEHAAIDYVNNPRGVSMDESGVTLSSIYNWFESDFTDTDGVLNHVRKYAQPELLARLNGVDRVKGYAYDWALNDSRASLIILGEQKGRHHSSDQREDRT